MNAKWFRFLGAGNQRFVRLSSRVIGPLLLLVPLAVQAQFYYAISNGTATITGYYGSSHVVTTPSIISGLPVVGIGDYAFTNRTDLVSITISNSVTSMSIGDFAFDGCRGLTNVTIGNGVTDIGYEAFADCTNLTGVTIGTNATNIGDHAFYYCTSLTNVTIGNSVIIIGNSAFMYCTSLRSVTIPNSVTYIGWYAFENCTSLVSVTIGNGVIGIGNAAFRMCAELRNATIGNSVSSIGGYAFAYCSGLTNITIPGSVANIAQNAFYTCPGLTGVYFQSNAPTTTYPLFNGDDNVTVYYLPGTEGWTSPLAGLPPGLWNPQMQTGDDSFGVRTNSFGFNITGTANIPMVVETTTSLENAAWSPILNCTLTNGSNYFSDPQWTNYPTRFYRIRSP